MKSAAQQPHHAVLFFPTLRMKGGLQSPLARQSGPTPTVTPLSTVSPPCTRRTAGRQQVLLLIRLQSMGQQTTHALIIPELAGQASATCSLP